jgi:ferredoxin-NADP reductase
LSNQVESDLDDNDKNLEPQPSKELNMKIVDIFDEIEEAKTYRFISAENEPIFKYAPGQAAKLYFDTPIKKNDFRLYSIASSPLRTDYLELTIKSEGGNFAPHFLARARIGDVYVVEGPFGRFLSKPLEMIKNKTLDRLVFLASSSGIVPFRCFIEYAIDSSLNVDLYLFYVNRTRNDVIYRRLIPELLSSYKKLKIMFNLTREHQVTEDEIAGQVIIDYENYRDRVSFLLGRRLEFEDIRNAVERWNEAYYAICGGARFIFGDREKGELGMIQKLELGGIDRKRIEIDSYGTK